MNEGDGGRQQQGERKRRPRKRKWGEKERAEVRRARMGEEGE